MLKYLQITFISLSLISCSAYQKTSVSAEDALNKGKVKVITNSGNEVKLESIVYEDSSLIGIKKGVKIPINPNQVQGVYLANPNNTILNKNTAYATLALIDLSINYERVIIGADVFSILLKISAGVSYVPEDWGETSGNGFQFLLQFIVLQGTASNFIEYGLGLGSWYQPADKNRFQTSIYGISFGSHTIYPPTEDYLKFFPAVNIGYRHQESNSKPLFRAGIGYPELLYVSMGYSF